MALFQRVVSRSLQLSWLRAWPSRWWPGRKERHGAVRVLLVCDECLARAQNLRRNPRFRDWWDRFALQQPNPGSSGMAGDTSNPLRCAARTSP